MPPAKILIRLLLVLAMAPTLIACSTKRTLTIDSRPSGAKLWVNGRLQQQRTPVAVPFVYYGSFEVRLEKEGYKSIGREIHLPAKIDGYPVIDLPLEMVVRNRSFRRVFDLELLSTDEKAGVCQAIRKRAEAFRKETYEAVNEPGTPGRETGK